MDELSEAGLDLELGEFGKRLDSLLISRGWDPKASRNRRAPFELSAKRSGTGAIRLVVDATLPEAAARQIIALIVESASPDWPGSR